MKKHATSSPKNDLKPATSLPPYFSWRYENGAVCGEKKAGIQYVCIVTTNQLFNLLTDQQKHTPPPQKTPSNPRPAYLLIFHSATKMGQFVGEKKRGYNIFT